MPAFAWGGLGRAGMPAVFVGIRAALTAWDMGWPLCFPQPLMLVKDPSSGGAASSSAAAMLN